jgi:hypothetical protein
MKLVLIVLLCLSILFVNISSMNLSGKPAKKAAAKKAAAKNGTAKNGSHKKVLIYTCLKPLNITKIPFGPSANTTRSMINGLGNTVKTDILLKAFPFEITRCDQMVNFPGAFINDQDDYRVRKKAFVSITAHYTNLYADKDGQKLIQHVVHTQVTAMPTLISGAEGCITVGHEKHQRHQKDMKLCTRSLANANNLLKVYQSFSRCRMGDSLTHIKHKNIKKLMELCKVDEKSLQVTSGDSKSHPAKAVKNTGKKLSLARKIAMNEAQKRKMTQFEFPADSNNKWEKERLSYFQPSKLRVPGSNTQPTKVKGITPGLTPIGYPLAE